MSGYAFTPARTGAPVLQTGENLDRAPELDRIEPLVVSPASKQGISYTGRGHVFYGDNLNLDASATVVYEWISRPIPFWGFVRALYLNFNAGDLNAQAVPFVTQQERAANSTYAARRMHQWLMQIEGETTGLLKGVVAITGGMVMPFPVDFLLPGPGWRLGMQTGNQGGSNRTAQWWFEVLEVVPALRG